MVIRRRNKFTFNKQRQKYCVSVKTETFWRFYEKLNKYMEIEPPSWSKRKCHISQKVTKCESHKTNTKWIPITTQIIQFQIRNQYDNDTPVQNNLRYHEMFNKHECENKHQNQHRLTPTRFKQRLSLRKLMQTKRGGNLSVTIAKFNEILWSNGKKAKKHTFMPGLNK